MNLLTRALGTRRRSESARSLSVDDYIGLLQSNLWAGNWWNAQQTLDGKVVEQAPTDLAGYAHQAYESCGPLFALIAVRMLVFSGIRLAFQRVRGGRPQDLYGTNQLGVLERPWPGGTTQDLLAQMLLDADLAGNAYLTRAGDELVRLRPDWVKIVLEKRPFRGGVLGYRRLGYLYTEGGEGSGHAPVALDAGEVAHFAPYPDPLASFRGMSWVTPVIRELINDKGMLAHQSAFLDHGATPNMVVKLDASVSPEMFERFKTSMDQAHQGVRNAYRTLYLGGGADVTVVGADMQQMAFTDTLGRGETRLASAAGVPTVIVGFSEGLEGSSLNAGNYGQARRRFSDGTLHPLWANAAGSLQTLVQPGPGARLWYDARDVPFLREDAADHATIQATEAQTISGLVKEGFTPNSAIAAVRAADWNLLEHSGLVSVQLQPPGQPDPSGDPPSDTADGDSADQEQEGQTS